MSIIIRLQGLPITASSLDIRRFFSGLTIPDGGVHIIGGQEGVAFIAFSNDEDARQAMTRENEGLIKDAKIKLYLSSRNEMKQVIDKARNQNLNGLKLKSNSSTATSSNVPNNSSSSGQTAISGQQSAAATNSSLLGNLQEPDYRRNRSPIDLGVGNKLAGDRLANLNSNKDQSLSPYANQRVKQLLEQVRTLDNEAGGSSNNNSTVRSRLGGFNLPSPTETHHHSHHQSAFDQHPMSRDSRWNGSMNGAANNGLAFDTSPLQSNVGSASLLITPHAHQQANPNRISNTNNASSFYDPHQSFSSINDNPVILNLPLQPTTHANRRCIVELRGLPINVQTVDFQTFFRPVGVLIDRDQIKLSLDEQALFHGVAHIFFNNEKDLEKALLLNGRSIRDYRIEVLPVIQSAPLLNTPLQATHSSGSNLDLLGAATANMNYGNEMLTNRTGGDSFTRRPRSFYPLFMKGIPYDACNVSEVARFFQPIPVFEVLIIQERNGRPNGNAYVLLDSEEAFAQAMRRNGQFMGKRYIELFPIQMDEVEKYRERVAYRMQQRDSTNDHPNRNRKRRYSDEGTHDDEQVYCVQIRGLPPNVHNRDLMNYFSRLNITASAVHIMLKADGTNAGECYVEFKSLEFLHRALRQDGDGMGSYILSIKEVAYSKVCSIVGIQPQNSSGNKLSRRDTAPERPEKRSTLLVKVSPKATVNDICTFFQDYDVRSSHVEPKDHNGYRNDEYFVHFRNRKEADRVIRNMSHKLLIDKPVYLKHAY